MLFQAKAFLIFVFMAKFTILSGSLLPEEGLQPAFAQLYIYDSEHENSHRHNIMPDLNDVILHNLLNMLDECNPYIHNFRHVRDCIQTIASNKIFMVIHADRTQDSCRYNAPSASEVAAIMVGDGHDLDASNRDIILRMRDRGLQRISETHPSYDPLHYVLLFPQGDDGWHVDIPLIGSVKRDCIRFRGSIQIHQIRRRFNQTWQTNFAKRTASQKCRRCKRTILILFLHPKLSTTMDAGLIHSP